MEIGFIALGCLAVLAASWTVERGVHGRRLKRIPLRICITGTRGKSTVTRLIASALRESGRRVLAKTTGSKAVVILPDGREKTIPRTGAPSILEQKKFLELARSLHADAVVLEMMSIRPENLRAESRTLIKSQLLVVTNVRLDHTDDMGRNKDEIAASLAAAIPEKGRMIVLEEEMYPVFRTTADRQGTEILSVPGGFGGKELGGQDFPGNARLALAAAEACGMASDAALRGIAKAGTDFGGFKIWTARRGGENWLLVSLFAANEPESSRTAIDALRRRYPRLPANPVALLNLRADRGDRTRQWLDALRAGFFSDFSRIVFIGDHAAALGRRKKIAAAAAIPVTAVSGGRPADIMDAAFGRSGDGGVVIGLGNMKGPGERLVEYWAEIGDSVP